MKYGRIAPSKDGVEVLRLSSVLRRCRDRGAPAEVAEAVERIANANRVCETHGYLDDPIIMTHGATDIAVICPWCSDPAVLQAWEDEGKKGVA